MPTPSRSETKAHYMARCVPYVMKEKGTQSNAHAVAKCNGMWEQSRKRVHNARRMNPLRLDPTRTTMIRRRFETDMKRRFDKFKRALWSLIVEEDAFGLTPRKPLVLHQRYAALMTPQQLEEFRRWVQGQVDQGILGRTRPGEPNWLQQYISESYEKGQGRAFDDAMKKYGYGGQAPPEYYQGSRDQFLRDAFRNPASVERVELLASRSFTDLKNVTEGMSTQLSRTLTDGIIQGRSPREVGRELNKVVDGYKNRGLTIARTETIRAHADGQLEALKQLGVEEVGVMVEWSAAADDLVCDLCRELDGAVFKLQEAQAIIPRHPNAVFAGSTFVPYGECLEAVRAEYSGPCIVLCAEGCGVHRTTIGPNHPMMTLRGMVRAADLREGDHVLYDLRNDGMFFRDTNCEQIPSSKDVFETLLMVSGNVTVASPGHDLHGDRVFCKGEVEAVRPTGSLLIVRESGGIEKLRELDLTRTNPNAEVVSGVRSEYPGGQAVLLPPAGGMGSSDSWIAADDHYVWLRVASVRMDTYEGYAFDYTTASSLYCSDGFVVSNCRCAWIPANVGEPEKGQKRGKEAQKALDESIKQEIPKSKREERTLEEQKKISRWAGADKKVQKPLTPKVSPQDKAKPKPQGTPKPRIPRKMSSTRKPSVKPPQPIGDWKAEAVLDAAERTASNSTTLPELYAKLKAKHPGLTMEEFQQGMLDLHRQGKLRLLEYTRAPAEIAGKLQIPSPAGDPYYYVQKPALWQGRKQ